MSYAPHSPHLASSGMPSPTLTNPDMILPYAEDNDDHHHQYHHRHHGAATAATALPSPPIKSFPYFASSQVVEASAAHLINHAGAASAEQQQQQQQQQHHILHNQRHSHGASLVHNTRTTTTTTAPAQLHEQGLALLPAGNLTAIAPAGASRQSLDLLPRDYPLKPTSAAAHSFHSIAAPRRSTSLRLAPYGGGGGGGGPDATSTHTHFSRLFGGGPHKPLRHYLAAQDRFSMTILEGDEQVAAVAAIGPGHDHRRHPSNSAALPEYADASGGGGGGEKSRADNDLGLFDLSEGSDEPASEMEGDEQSSAALSRRADWILAAAKRKLDALEGNLSRARHSIRMSPSPPPSSSRSSSAAAVLPIPARVANAERSHAVSAGTAEADKHTRLLSTPVSRIVAGHARGVSDTTKAYTTSYGTHSAAARDVRSARAQTAYGQRFRAASAAQTRPESAPANERSNSSVTKTTTTTSTTRDVPAAAHHSKGATPVGQRNYLSSFSTPNRLALERFLAPRGPIKLSDNGDDDDDSAFGANGPASAAELSSSSGWQQDPRGLSRSRSVVPIREVRDQMEDLKGRISSLQQRAKQDHLKRRSLQNLRSGSPAADAEQWYLSAGNYANGGLSTSAGVGRAERPAPSSTGSEAAAENDASLLREDRPSESGNDSGNLPSGGDASGDAVEADREVMVAKDSNPVLEQTSDAEDQLASAEQDDDDDFASAADQFEEEDVDEAEEEEDEPEYAPAVSERHEDRADAFDYEHFFLHSGMGHYSSTRLGRRNSYSSDGSIETTKATDTVADDTPKRSTSRGARITADAVDRSSSGGPAAADVSGDDYDPALQGRVMERNHSVVSMSSMTSFATATEGNDDDYDYGDRLGFVSPATQQWALAAAATTTSAAAVAPIAGATSPRSGEHPVLVFGPGGGLVAAAPPPPPSHTLHSSSSATRSDDDGSHTPTQADHIHGVGGYPGNGSSPRGRSPPPPQQQHPLDEFFLYDTPADGLARRFSSASLVLSRRQRHGQRQQQQQQHRPQRLRSPPPPPPMPLLPPPPPPAPPSSLSLSSSSSTAPTPAPRTSSLPSTTTAASRLPLDDGSRALWALLAAGTTAGGKGGGDSGRGDGGGNDSCRLTPEDEALLAPIVSGLQRLCAQLLRSSSSSTSASSASGGDTGGTGADDVSAARATLERVRTALLPEPNETKVR